MKVRAYSLSPVVVHVIAVLCAAVCLDSAPSTARAAGVVGTGTPASCTDAALDTALARGGLVTFNCGGPATIDVSPNKVKTISADTTINGRGQITISGGFYVNNVNFTMEYLTIADTGSGEGDGPIVNYGSLTVTHCTFMGNRSGDDGGAIANYGTLSIANSTFTDNAAGGGGDGAPGRGAGIFNGGSLIVTNSTFTGNRAFAGGAMFNSRVASLAVYSSTFTGNIATGLGADGGGISNSGGLLTVTNSTFIGNRAATGGGIDNSNDGGLIVTNSTFIDGSAANETYGGAISSVSFAGGTPSYGRPVEVYNTIVANSLSGSNCYGDIADYGHNLDDGASCGFGTAHGSLSNTDPQLDPAGLRDNGGPTQTVALCTGAGEPGGCTTASPAIDAGDPEVCAAGHVSSRDQRGFARPGVGHTQCSIGAFEADATAPQACVGDCNDSSRVTVDELVRGVNMLLSDTAPDQCQAFDCNGSGHVTVDCLVQGVNSLLNGCGLGQ